MAINTSSDKSSPSDRNNQEKGKDQGPKNEKAKALEMAIQGIERQFGKGSIMKLGGADAVKNRVASIPTGSIGLDAALGIGGVPRGRVI